MSALQTIAAARGPLTEAQAKELASIMNGEPDDWNYVAEPVPGHPLWWVIAVYDEEGVRIGCL